MVKKNYVAPAANEARTKLRTGLLAGSNVSFQPGPDKGDSNEFKNARARQELEISAASASSLD